MDPPLISAPPNSVLWMKLIHSRWLLIQLKGFSIELVDQNAKTPLITCSPISGVVDGAVVEQDDNLHYVKLHVSTSSYVTYTFLLGLHCRSECGIFVAQIDFWEVISGFSGILDQMGSLSVFSRSTGNAETGFVNDVSQNGNLQLRCNVSKSSYTSASPETPGAGTSCEASVYQLKNEVIDAIIREDAVAVARTYTLDLYSTSKIIPLLPSQPNRPTMLDTPPCQSLVYPGLRWPLHLASILREPRPRLFTSPDAIVVMSTDVGGCYGVAATPSRSSETPSSSSSSIPLFIGEKLIDMADPGLQSFCVVWARRDNGPTKKDPHLATKSGSDLARWAIPGRLSDFPLHLDFDEKTGICAAAMASGRIWVMDSTTFSNYGKPGHPLPRGLAFESPETAKELPDPSPEPFRWPLTTPLPAPFGIKLPTDKPKEVAPEVAHIPIRRYCPESNGTSSTACQSEKESWAKTVLFTTNEAHPFSFSRGYEEVIEVKAVPGALKTNIVSGSYRDCGASSQAWMSIEQLCEHSPLREWPIDYGKLDQFLAWRDHYFKNFGRPGEKLLP
ncbi:hypothetical protein M407DRAFT_17669 [Tulasnella calospora MUT 4182]|uniref:Uncharacterized protein n=1 Tax=Tulasnella calospora MUT 4182 TaxID=1051891 RepID=A0A0C3QL64_9AGAM|nr:hypothetical protein M407DRAFT_17669 [Tulasnella calospora MUT 4182]